MTWLKGIIVAAFGASLAASAHEVDVRYVAVFSVDGLHSSDVDRYVALRPNSTIAALLQTGYEYRNAFASAPSDSFPGILNQFTGAGPRTTGVWYDNIYDRSFYPPFSESGQRCSGRPVTYDESIDYNDTQRFSGGINPENLPQAIVNGKCQVIYPHQRLRVNTIWEVVESRGGQTAYADKHPAYDLVRGPSGNGLTAGYFPEIAAFANTVEATIAFDQLHVDAFLQWIVGTTPVNSEVQAPGLTKTPILFGGNFQAVSVGQKTSGYVNGTLAFTPKLLQALDFVDASLGRVVAALKSRRIYEETLIIIASKHGQAPIDPRLFKEVNPNLITTVAGVNISSVTTDDIALIFLQDPSTVTTAVKNLNTGRTTLHIQDIIYGDRLTRLGFGNPRTDPAVPDIIIRPELGVIYSTSKAKIAEHGGLSNDDRNVACFVSNPRLKKTVFAQSVSTKQVAPTVLKALDISPYTLAGVRAEGTQPLVGF